MEKKDIKHYFVVGGILCAIGASSALLIGLTNVATYQTIEKNEKAAEQKALESIYSKDKVDYGEKTDINKSNFKTLDEKQYGKLLSFWNPKEKGATEDDNSKYGYIFKCEGMDKNGYGKVTMLAEVKVEGETSKVGKISIIKNTESYASTVQQYVDKYNNGGNLADVNCGATYGATLIKEMAEASAKFVSTYIK